MLLAENILNDPKCLRWFRVCMLLEFCGKQILKDIFHIDLRAPEKCPEKLYKFLSSYKCQLQFLNSEEHKKVYPLNENTDEEKFDVPLYAKIINAILGAHLVGTDEYCKQKRKQMEKDKNFTNWLRHWRNELFHKGDKHLSELEFMETWKEVSEEFLKYNVDEALVKDLKNCNIFSDAKYQKIAFFLLSQGRNV